MRPGIPGNRCGTQCRVILMIRIAIFWIGSYQQLELPLGILLISDIRANGTVDMDFHRWTIATMFGT